MHSPSPNCATGIGPNLAILHGATAIYLSQIMFFMGFSFAVTNAPREHLH